MWAQLISVRIKPGREGDVPQLLDLLRKSEQPDSGLVRETLMLDQNDPGQAHVLAVFESEDRARQREGDSRRAEGLAKLQALMAEMLDGPPTFTHLEVVDEFAP